MWQIFFLEKEIDSAQSKLLVLLRSGWEAEKLKPYKNSLVGCILSSKLLVLAAMGHDKE